jgi:hypothetical protein
VSPETWFGEIHMPVRRFQCRACGATFRPDDAALGVPGVGEFSDDVRWLYAPMAAALPHRVANAVFARCTGVTLSSCGAQGSIDSTAEDLRTWQVEREVQEASAVGHALAAAESAADLRVEIAMDGVTAHVDGRWQQPKVATILVRQLEARAEKPTLGAVLARRYASVLGSAEDLAVRIQQVFREAGWEHIPIGEILGDGAPWIWNLADAHFPGASDAGRLLPERAPLCLCPSALSQQPCGGQGLVEQNIGARLTERVGEVLSALKRMQPWQTALCHALAQLIGSVEDNRTRIKSQEPWRPGLAVGSGAVEGACKQVIHCRFKRASMRWNQPGVLNLLALRIAHVNETFQAFWASRGLTVQVPG